MQEHPRYGAAVGGGIWGAERQRHEGLLSALRVAALWLASIRLVWLVVRVDRVI